MMTAHGELLYITFMRKILLFVLFLNVLGLGSKFEENEMRRFYQEKLEAQRSHFGEARDSLLQSLQNKDFEAASRYIELLTDSVFGAYALDRYELLQIYLSMDKLDSAVATLVRDYDSRLEPYAEGAYKHVGVYSSSFDDKLNKYLDENVNLSTRENLRKQLNRTLSADVNQEYKDLADLMSFVFERDTIKRKTSSDQYEKYMRYGVWRDDFVEKDSVYFDSLITKYSAFQNQYPESEFYTWARRENYLERKVKNIKNTTKHYYVERYYTGGLGVEYFHAIGSGFQINGALQYHRYILGLGYSEYEDDYGDGFVTYLGWDAYESKFIKTFPFVTGVFNQIDDFHWGGGLQFEFRPWISELGHDAPIGGYLTIKARYELMYGKVIVDRLKDEKEKKLRNHFYLGVGFHLW